MGLFDKILEKLDLKKEPVKTGATTTKDSRPVVTKTPTTKVATKAATKVATTLPKKAIPVTKAQAPVAIPEVDVVAKLEKLAKASSMKLNWKTSIVDLLTLLGIESTLDNRKELAKELGCPAEKIGGDYSEMNMWLHKTVLKKIAENGGNIPKNLLD